MTRPNDELPAVIPDRTQWRTLQPPVRPSVLRLAELLADGLPDGWTVALQPRIGNSRPDVVALNPDVGVAVYEVDDWNQDEREMAYDPGEMVLKARPPGGDWYRSRNPVGQVYKHRDVVAEVLDPMEPGRTYVTAVVVMANCPTEEAKFALRGMIRTEDRTPGRCSFFRIVGSEALKQGSVRALLPAAFNPKYHHPLKPSTVDRFAAHFAERAGMRPRGELLKLDSDKRKILENPDGVKMRRIKGAVGTGKSALLAGAAVKASLEGRKVLLVGFNITLRHYLRDLISRIRWDGVEADAVARAVRDNVTVMYLHEWCKQVCRDTGLEKQLRVLLGGARDLGFGYPTDEIKALVREGIETRHWSPERETTVSLYDTVLIDEAQNIDADWFALLRDVLRDDRSELLLTADPTQSLYREQGSWTDEKMAGCGFSGPWGRLDGSYRLPLNAVPMAADFCKRFLSERDDVEVPIPDAEQQTDLLCTLRYRNVVGSECLVDGVAEAIHQAPDLLGVPKAQMSFVVPRHQIGLEVLEQLEHLDPGWGGLVRHVFSSGFFGQQRLKFSFFPDPDLALGATIHCFQGWETRCLVLGIPALEDDSPGDSDNAYTRDYWTSVYIGLTRVAISQAGSHLIVVNEEPRLEEFLRDWFEAA